MKVFSFACRFLIGGVLIWSAAVHLENSWVFLHAIMDYRIVSFDIARPLVTVLPPLQLVTGILLVADVWSRLAGGLALLLLITFTIAQISALVRGLEIGCGCFGSTTEVVSWLTIGRNLFLIFCSSLVIGTAKRNDES